MFEKYRRPTRNAWGRQLNEGRGLPVVDLKTYSRFNDLTFSLGRKTNTKEAHDLLVEAGCFKNGELLKYVNQLRVTGSMDNGKIFVECNAPGHNDVFVEKLNNLNLPEVTIKKCHSYSNKDVLVRFSYIHSSVDIKTEIVDNFLCKYGEVVDWWPIKDKELDIPTGPYIFVMKEEDIKRNPIPQCVFLNHIQVYISHRLQDKVCHRCGKSGHMFRECTSEDFPGLQAGNKSFDPRNNFLSGVLPKRVTSQVNKELATSTVLDQLAQSSAVSESVVVPVLSSAPIVTTALSSAPIVTPVVSQPAGIQNAIAAVDFGEQSKILKRPTMVSVTLSDFRVPAGSAKLDAKVRTSSTPKSKRTRHYSDGDVGNGVGDSSKKSKTESLKLICAANGAVNLGSGPIRILDTNQKRDVAGEGEKYDSESDSLELSGSDDEEEDEEYSVPNGGDEDGEIQDDEGNGLIEMTDNDDVRKPDLSISIDTDDGIMDASASKNEMEWSEQVPPIPPEG